MLLDGAKTLNRVLERRVNYRFVCILLCIDWQKLMQKFAILTHAVETDSSQLAFRFCGLLGKWQEGYLPVLKVYKEQAHRLEYKHLIHYSCGL